MARKRINIKFVVIGITALLMIAALGVAYKFRKRILLGSPEKLLAEAKSLMDQGEYDKAGKLLYDTATVGGADPYVYVLLGDVWDLKAGEDPNNNIGKARGDVFLDRMAERLAERGVAVKRYAKPSPNRPAVLVARERMLADTQVAVIGLAE